MKHLGIVFLISSTWSLLSFFDLWVDVFQFGKPLVIMSSNADFPHSLSLLFF